MALIGLTLAAGCTPQADQVQRGRAQPWVLPRRLAERGAQAGADAARRDLARGALRVHAVDLSPDEMRAGALRRAGVEVDRSGRDRDYVRAYTRIMGPRVEARLTEQGQADARADLAAGEVKMLVMGSVGAKASRRLRVAGLRLESAGGRVVTSDLVAYVDAYNATMRPAIDRRYPGLLGPAPAADC